MADPVLHIKDSYYFEVPKVLCPSDFRRRQQFPDVWISLDPQFQDWEAERLYAALARREAGLPPKEDLLHQWQHWVHADDANFAKPLDVYLDEKYQEYVAKFSNWKSAEVAAARAKRDGSVDDVNRLTLGDYLTHAEESAGADKEFFNFFRWRDKYENASAFERAKTEAGDIREWKLDKSVPEWNEAKLPDGRTKLAAYNAQLSGKILIPQPFATLRNLYEKESGFAISKYLVLEIVVGLVLLVLFSSFAAKIRGGRPAKGKFWNLIEVFLLFIRDQIARPVLGSHDHEEASHAEKPVEAGESHHAEAVAHGEHGHGTAAQAHGAVHGGERQGHAHHVDPANKFVPLLWTVFFFVLGCNLMGMVPWAGSPTAAFSVTLAMACVAFVTTVLAGTMQFGFTGFLMNQIPSMELPWYMAIVIKPMILVIELLGLCIKHGVLAVRLLANMVAGHLVLIAIMGFAFSAEAALTFAAPGADWKWGYIGWGLVAALSIGASAALSCLELFVAFLQAYIFTFLTALFIGAAIHKH